MPLLQAPARPAGPLTRSLRSHQAQSSPLAASSRRLHRRSLRVRAENNNNNNNNNSSNNPLDALRDVVASRPVAQKAVLRLLLSPGLTGTLAVAGCYLAKMSSPLSALLAPPTAADVAVGLAAAVPLVALDALLLGPFYQPEAPRRQFLPTTSPSPSPSSSSAAAESSSPSSGEGEKEKEGGGGGTAAERGEEAAESPKRPDPAVVEAGRLALLRSLSASGVAVFDAGALASGSSSSSSETSGGEKGEDSLFTLFRRRLRSAAHAYASRAVRSTLAREIPGNPVAEAALVVAARAGTELLARSFALRLAGGWVADRVVEGGGLAGEDALVSLLAAARAPPDAPLGTAGELLVLAATAAGLVGIGVAGVVAAEAEAARSAAEVERRSRSRRSEESSSSSNGSSTEEASTDGAGPASSTTAATTTTAEALERGSLAVMRQISRARADAALLDASLDAARLLVVGGAFVASGDHVAASLLATVVRELPFRRWLVKRSAARAERVRREARAEFEKLVEGDEKFLALRRAMEERREKRSLWLKRQEELRSGVGGGLGGGGSDRRRRDDDDERGDGKDEL